MRFHILRWESSANGIPPKERSGNLLSRVIRVLLFCALLRILQSEEEAVVLQTEAAGLLYSIVWEETHESYVALYMKMDEVIDEFAEGIGVKVDLKVPDAKMAVHCYGLREIYIRVALVTPRFLV